MKAMQTELQRLHIHTEVLRYMQSPEGKRQRQAILEAWRQQEAAAIEQYEKTDARRWLLRVLCHVAQRQRH